MSRWKRIGLAFCGVGSIVSMLAVWCTSTEAEKADNIYQACFGFNIVMGIIWLSIAGFARPNLCEDKEP